MTRNIQAWLAGTAALVAVLAVSLNGRSQQPPAQPRPGERELRFKSGVEVVNVTATVTDASGRFVSGLRKEDFRVYEDGRPVEVTHFSAERVPVSLGIALDTSGSMAGDKIKAAEAALNRFLYDLLAPSDEIFLYRFSNAPVLLESWTTDRDRLSRALGNIVPSGGTALYDTIAEAIPLAQTGRHVKKALVVISDGNDTSSRIALRDLKAQIRQSELLVYAVGIDAEGEPTFRTRPRRPPRMPMPLPFPFPPGRRPEPIVPPPGRWSPSGSSDVDRVNVDALRELTDDSGGRTEIIRYARDLDPATAGVADELSKQYYLGYTPPGTRDGRWHSIRVEVRNPSYHVRARRGYVAS
ncbi:MAG: VWA domain-containing protein [Betaproteobacteria bacterium]